MARLPIPGSDDNTWGDILNEFLSIEHNPDGSLKRTIDIDAAQDSIEKGQPDGYASLDGSGKVPASQLPLSDSITDGVTTVAPTQNAVFDALSDKLTKNAAIPAATKTKITYDTNGLVTSGADALTLSAIAPVTPAEGDQWFNTSTGFLFLYYGTTWVEVTPTLPDLVQGPGVVLETISNVTTISLGDRTAGRIMGRKTADGAGPPQDLTVPEAKVLLDIDDLEFNIALAGLLIQDNGWLYPMTFEPQNIQTAGAMTSAPRTVYSRMSGKTTTAVNKATIHLGVSSGNISVAVYANNGSTGSAARPTGAPLLTTGAIASPGTGTQTVTFTSSAVVPAGAWFAISADNTTVTFSRANASILLPGVCYVETAHPCPVTVGSLTTNAQRQFGAVHA